MSNRVLIGLLAASAVAMWGTEASAYNRINGVIIKHSSPLLQVLMSGEEDDSILDVQGGASVEILCEKPGNRILKRKVRHDKTEQFERKVAFNFARRLVDFPSVSSNAKGVQDVLLDLSSAKCPAHFLKVGNSAVLKSPDIMVAWEKCVGSTARGGDPCFKGGVKTTEPIETVKISNCLPGKRDPEDGSVPAQILTCNVVQVGPDGPPPPPPPGCGDGAETRKRPY